MVKRIACAVTLFLCAAPAFAHSPRTRPLRTIAWERVLLPFVGEASTAGGYWVSQFWLRTDNPRGVRLFFPFPCRIGTGCPANAPFVLQSDQTVVNPTYAGATGVFMHVESDRLRDLIYTLRSAG